MKVKLAQIVLALYLTIISILIKDYNPFSWLLFASVFLLSFFLGKNEFFLSLENLVYIIIALSVFPDLLFLFALYLPFSIFGMLFSKRSFIKSYIFGFTVSILTTMLLYTASNYISMKLNFLAILLFFYFPPAAALFVWIRKNGSLDFLRIDFEETFLMLAILAATAFVAINIVDNENLFISNGTYMFSKFNLIVKTVNSESSFPIYDPATSSGESPFLFEAPLFFSHLAFANIILKQIPQVAFYNLYSFFSLFLAILSLSLLLRRLVIAEGNKIDYTFAVAIGSLSIGLHFYFVQFLEAFKESFTFPINYLIFALMLERPRQFKEIVIIAFMSIFTFILHAPHGVGIVLISSSLAFLMLAHLYFSQRFSEVKQWLVENKKKMALAGFLILLLPLFYVGPTVIFKDFLEDKKDVKIKDFKPRPEYFQDFIQDENLGFSLKYPEIIRNDDKKFGPFISIFGLFSLSLAISLRSRNLSNLKFFTGAYGLHFLISSFIIVHPMVGSLEYGYRTAAPYMIIILVASMAALIANTRQKYVKMILMLIFLAGLVYMLPLSKANIENIHVEDLIAGDSFKPEIDFLNSLPNDGRVITYGLFANAFDPSLAALTDKYFSRYHLTEMARSRSIYSKIHGTNSFGQEDFVFEKSGTELYNYLRLGGYRYIFADICYIPGAFIAKSLYPDFVRGIYQSQCLVFFNVNGTNYAEKVSVLEKFDEEVYKAPEGYKYFSLSPHFDFGSNIPYSKNAAEPRRLEYKRASPAEVVINGPFENNDWVVFKEDYFTRWKAFMGNQEIPVMATNHNSILVKTNEGPSITLKYSMLPAEKAIGSLSFVSAFSIIIILIAWLRKTD